MLNGFDSKTAHNTFKAQILFIRMYNMHFRFKKGKKNISFQISDKVVIVIILVLMA